MEINISFSEWLHSLLVDKRLNQKQLATRSGVSQGQISKILNESGGYSTETLRKIAGVLGVTEEEMYRRAGLLKDTPGEHPPDVNYLVNAMTDHQIEEWIEYGRYILDRDERKRRGQ